MCEDYDDQYDAAEVLEMCADGPPPVNGLAVFEGRVRQLTFEQFKTETLGCGVVQGELVTNTVRPRTGKTQFLFEGPLAHIVARMNYAECEARALALREKVGTLPGYRAVPGSRTVSLLPGEAMPEDFRKQLSAAFAEARDWLVQQALGGKVDFVADAEVVKIKLNGEVE